MEICYRTKMKGCSGVSGGIKVNTKKSDFLTFSISSLLCDTCSIYEIKTGLCFSLFVLFNLLAKAHCLVILVWIYILQFQSLCKPKILSDLNMNFNLTIHCVKMICASSTLGHPPSAWFMPWLTKSALIVFT